MEWISQLIGIIGVWVSGVISATGYVGVGLLMAVESCCVPIPSELIMPFAGFLVADGKLNLWWTAFAGAFGCVVGSVVAYGIGMWGGRPFVEKYGKYILVAKRDLDTADRWFARWGEGIVFVSRLLPVVRTFISFPAGVARMNFPRFVVYTFLGSFPWCLGLAWVGQLLGENWEKIGDYFHGADIIIGVLIVAGLALYIGRHIKHAREDNREGKSGNKKA